MERVEAGPHAHGVMPHHGKRPPHQSPQNALPESERKNVALAREQPGHRDSADPRERNENRIRPMKRGKDRTRNQGSAHRTFGCGEKTISYVGIQPHLLEKAKGQVAKEMFRNPVMVERSMQTTKNEAHDAKTNDEWHKDDCRAFGGIPQIVRPPTNRFWSVPVKHEAGGQPNGKHDPR